MLVVVFRTRIRPGVDEEALNALGTRMQELAAAAPGYISSKDFTAADGENVTVVEFASAETLLAWKNHPEHLEAQRLGREKFFTEYRIQVCAPVREYAFPRREGSRDLTSPRAAS